MSAPSTVVAAAAAAPTDAAAVSSSSSAAPPAVPGLVVESVYTHTTFLSTLTSAFTRALLAASNEVSAALPKGGAEELTPEYYVEATKAALRQVLTQQYSPGQETGTHRRERRGNKGTVCTPQISTAERAGELIFARGCRLPPVCVQLCPLPIPPPSRRMLAA